MGLDIKELDLNSCKNLIDVSNIPEEVKKLNLNSCLKLKDISSLGGVEDLNIALSRVSDISSLRSVKKLTVDLLQCNITKGLDILENVDKLNLVGGYNFTAGFLNKLKASEIGVEFNNLFRDTSLLIGRHRNKVYLNACDNVMDLSPLSKIKKVHFRWMNGITNQCINSLSKCEEVILD